MQRSALGSIDVNSLLGSPAPIGGRKAAQLEQTPKGKAALNGRVNARGRRGAGCKNVEEQSVQLVPPEELQELLELESAFIPRETKTPFLKRKIRQFESEAEPLQLKKPLCRLEREKLEASQANAAAVVNEIFWEPFFHSLLVREGLAPPRHDDLPAVSSRARGASAAAGPAAGLGSLPVHKSKLELMKEAADARRQQAEAGSSAGPSSLWSPLKRPGGAARVRLAAAAGAPGAAAGGLSDLKVHKSGLELAKEAAVQAGAAPQARRPASARGRAEQQPAAAAGGLSDLKVHKSRLEREKEAALAAAAAAAAAAESGDAGRGEDQPLPLRAPADSAGWGGSGLGDMKVHKSGLERAKEDALRERAAGGAVGRNPRVQARAADDWARWDGMPLAACVKTHTTRLEKEQAAWKAAAAIHEAKRQQENRSGGSDKSRR